MLALGFDPGTRSVGWGYFAPESPGARVKYGVLEETLQKGSILAQIWVLLQKTQPAVIGIEDPQLYSDKYGDPQTAKAVFMSLTKTANICGSIEGMAYTLGIPVKYYHKSAINKELAGYAQAKKGALQELVRLWLGLKEPIRPQHANDSIAVAIVAYNHFALEKRIVKEDKP